VNSFLVGGVGCAFEGALGVVEGGGFGDAHYLLSICLAFCYLYCSEIMKEVY
jgi:hypothetical protein